MWDTSRVAAYARRNPHIKPLLAGRAVSPETSLCVDPAVLNLWHPLAALSELSPDRDYRTTLLGYEIVHGIDAAAEPWVVLADRPDELLPVDTRYGYVWTSIGEPPGAVFDIPEALEPDRRLLNACSIQVATSAPRAVENFLDMGHFPYVHTGLLGEEPHTEVVDYHAGVEGGEVWARDCLFFQPVAAMSAAGGQMTDYTYRVPHPYCVVLYKTVAGDPSRRDVIALFVQAMTQEKIRAHNFLCLVDSTSTDNDLKKFQQIIFSQDKPILENQYPKRLPLDPRAETPIRADQSSIAYRRWLSDLGVDYSVVRAR